MEPVTENPGEIKDGSKSSPSSKVPPEDAPDPTIESDTKVDPSEEIAADKTEKEQVDEETAEDVPPTPEIKYTLELASEDIDHFLSDLSEMKEKGVPLEIPDFVHKFLDLVDDRIEKLNSGDDKTKFGHDPEVDALLLETVSRVSKLLKSLPDFKPDDSNNNDEMLVNRIGGIHQRAMAFLEDEFRNLLEDCNSSEQTESARADGKPDPDVQGSPGSTDELSTDFLRYSPRVLSILKLIAKELIYGGLELECRQVYMLTRRHVFDVKLSEIGFERIGMDDVHKMNWELLEREIQTWNSSFRHCAAFYFCGERKLSDEVFADYPLLGSTLFTNLNRGVVLQFLNFAEAVAMTKRSSEKLFKLLDMYETVRDHVPAVEGLFPEACANELQMETMTSRCRLGEAAISMFCDLENSIKSETNKTPVPGGAVHPLTRYTMNYLKYACEYHNSLEQIFKEHSKLERADSTSKPRPPPTGGEEQKQQRKGENDNQSPFVPQLMRIMDLLDANLEAKSKLYKDISLANIFLMNNGRYILQKIKGSAETYELLGDHWCRKRSTDLRNYHKNYQRETWMKLIGCLSHDGLMSHGKIVKPALKEKFKSFTAMFDEIHRTQSAWVVSDEQLQSELRVSISAVVIPAYRSFMGRFSQYLDPGRQTEKYIKYQSDDLETCIEELFDGNAATSFMSRRKT